MVFPIRMWKWNKSSDGSTAIILSMDVYIYSYSFFIASENVLGDVSWEGKHMLRVLSSLERKHRWQDEIDVFTVNINISRPKDYCIRFRECLWTRQVNSSVKIKDSRTNWKQILYNLVASFSGLIFKKPI